MNIHYNFPKTHQLSLTILLHIIPHPCFVISVFPLAFYHTTKNKSMKVAVGNTQCMYPITTIIIDNKRIFHILKLVMLIQWNFSYVMLHAPIIPIH